MKIYLDSIGCRLNQSEIERMARQFKQTDHVLVGSPEESELAVINTCTVTAKAAADSRKMTRGVNRRNPVTRIVLTGCWSSMEPESAATLPGVDKVVHNDDKDHLVSRVLGLAPESLEASRQSWEPVPGARKRTRAFIKVQDGCNNRCAFCLTTIARGPARSRPIENILNDVHAASVGGALEVVLTGVHLSAYGQDRSEDEDLVSMVRAILTETDLPRVRLSSLEPWNLPEDLDELLREPRVCRQLHLPLQSGCEATLDRMGRPIRPEEFDEIVDTFRQTIPGLAVTTDIIVGFPGENEKEFQESLNFIERISFARAHVFTYSPRPHTVAVSLPNQVSPHEARIRSQMVREVVERSRRKFMNQFVGKVMTVLWESDKYASEQGRTYTGLTDNYLNVHTCSDDNLWNHLTPVYLASMGGEGLQGELVSEQGVISLARSNSNVQGDP
jgi:threonylcarbamoyladenosine tRNA methylthiotransferase MtaB